MGPAASGNQRYVPTGGLSVDLLICACAVDNTPDVAAMTANTYNLFGTLSTFSSLDLGGRLLAAYFLIFDLNCEVLKAELIFHSIAHGT